MTKKELMVKAHKMTKEIKTQYPGIDYKFQLGLCLAYLQKEGENEMVELNGTEKQVKWANDIRKKALEGVEIAIEKLEEIQKGYVETRGKRLKRFDKYINKVNEIKEELLNSVEAKFFIEKYSYVSKYSVESCADEIIKIAQNLVNGF